MAQLVQWWETFESNGRSLSELTIPRFGNQGGASVNGHLILPQSVFSEFYARLLAGFAGCKKHARMSTACCTQEDPGNYDMELFGLTIALNCY